MFSSLFCPVAEKPPTRHVANVPASPPPLEDGKHHAGLAKRPATFETETELLIPETTAADAEASSHKLDKQPLLESILGEMAGKEPHPSVSPHRLIQAAKTLVLCGLYMCIGKQGFQCPHIPFLHPLDSPTHTSTRHARPDVDPAQQAHPQGPEF